MKQVKRSLQIAGFTAIELIIVLIVGFSIIALSASRMGDLFSRSNSMQAYSSILDLYVSGRALAGPNGYGEDGADLLQSLVDAGTLPKNLMVSKNGTSTAANEWGQPISMLVINGGLGFSIAYPGVPKDSCVGMIPNLLKSGNFSAIKVGDKTVAATASTSDITTACADPNGTGLILTVEVNGATEGS